MMGKEKKLILIVDDNSDNRKLLGNLLTKEGYDVGLSKDGFNALDFVEKVKPNLILLDIMMPEMDGYEVCEKLKANMATQHIPIIFLTAKTSTKDIVKGFKVGGVDYVAKPYNSEELLARVRTHIELDTLRGLLPICSVCKSIRDDKGYWHSLESYVQNHSNVLFSHSLCDPCAEDLYGGEEWFEKSRKKKV